MAELTRAEARAVIKAFECCENEGWYTHDREDAPVVKALLIYAHEVVEEPFDDCMWTTLRA